MLLRSRGTFNMSKDILLLVASVLYFYTYEPTLSEAAVVKPHVIFILADDLGWYDVPWHNSKVISPRLEELARQGIILNQSYVQPVCTPTRAALLTGRYPFTIGRQHKVLKPESPTGLLLNATLLSQAMKDAGYSTHIVGKWHLGFCDWKYTPTMRGFDTFFGYYTGAQNYWTHVHGAKNHGPPIANIPRGYDFRNNTEPETNVRGIYSTYSYASYVKDLLTSRNPNDPMFLYFPLQTVHGVLMVPQIYSKPFRYLKDKDRKKKLGMISAMDELIGTTIDALKQTGHYENSVIVFSTDNGGPARDAGVNYPLRGRKGTLWEGGTRGVAFVHSPLLTKTGFVSETLVHVTDWFKTLVGLAGGVVPTDTDGFDQWEAITTGSTSPRTSFVYNIDIEVEIKAAIRKGDFKLIVGSAGLGEWDVPPEDPNIRIERNVSSDNNTTFGTLGLDVNDFGELTTSISNNTKIRLYNIKSDERERQNLADSELGIVVDLLKELQKEIPRLIQADELPPAFNESDPAKFNNIWSPGWCTAK